MWTNESKAIVQLKLLCRLANNCEAFQMRNLFDNTSLFFENGMASFNCLYFKYTNKNEAVSTMDKG